PMSDETVARVKDFDPETIHLLPLYPQFSTTTTGSSLDDWRRAAARAGLDAPATWTCCYPTHVGWVSALAGLTALALNEPEGKGARILFSAHGLPKKIVAAGDPYQAQVEQTAAAVVGELESRGVLCADWTVCYQSRVGPLEWIGPSLDEALSAAAADGVPVVVVPIAFVSEHSETLVELDIEYRNKARDLGVPGYLRVPAVGTDPDFISTLAALVAAGGRGDRACPDEWKKCPHTGGTLG
ncbi:MAG: ferrochelatase, partial [Rhodospirillales bacterium]|nr:ferrochelatase [Rhodospirillales bacterium]